MNSRHRLWQRAPLSKGAAAPHRAPPPYGPCISHTLCTWLHRSSTGSKGDAAGAAVHVALREAGSTLNAGVLESELTEVQDWLSRTALPSASEMSWSFWQPGAHGRQQAHVAQAQAQAAIAIEDERARIHWTRENSSS